MKLLTNKLRQFLASERGSMQFSESLALKAVSLLLALILWITILGFKREELKINVKLEPLLAPGMMITNKIPAHIQLTLSGPRVLLRDVEKKIQPIQPDLRRTRETTIQFSVSEDLIGDLIGGLPATVRITSFYPPNILIRMEEVVEKYIEVKPTLKGALAAGFEIASVKVVPPTIAVSGPKSLLALIESVGTEPFDIKDLGKGSREGVVAVEVDTTQGFQLSRDRVVQVVVKTKRVANY